jgi:hypothetical protein
MPRRARYLVPQGMPRRDEVLALCLVVAVLGHVLFAQLTLILAVVFYLITRITRWRLSWLAVPAAGGLVWTVAVGPGAAIAGFTAGPARVARYLGASGQQVNHLLHFTNAFTGMASWLPRQLPLALVAGAAEAALAGWLTWLHTDEQYLRPARPGLLAAARRAATVRSIRAGGVVTRDGGCLGVTAGTGSRVTLSWAEAAGGVAVCGSAAPDVLTTSFQLVHAAVRRRKPVLAVDFSGDPDLPGRLAAVCAAAGAPLQVFGASRDAADWAACYEPFRHGDPARRAALIAAMASWDGPGRQYRRSCLAYLQDVFELLDAAPGDPRAPVLDEVLHLLNPTAMRARMAYVPAAYARRDALAERAAVSMSLLHAEPATAADLTRQLRELRGSGFARWLRPAARPGGEIDLGRAVTERAVVLFRLGGTTGTQSPEMLCRLIGQDLLVAGSALNRIGVDGDGLIWLAECGSMPRGPVTGMISHGAQAGLPVLATTTAGPVAADLARLVNVVVAHQLEDAAAAGLLSALGLPAVAQAAAQDGPPDPAGPPMGRTEQPPSPPPMSTLGPGEFLLAVRNPPRVVPHGRAVRARVPALRPSRGTTTVPQRAWEGA